MKRISRGRPLTPDEAKKYDRLRKLVEKDKPAIEKMAREYQQRRDRVSGLVAALKNERQRLGLSLADVRERSGLDRSALSRLENGQPENPTVETLLRYAEAVGCQVVIQAKAK